MAIRAMVAGVERGTAAAAARGGSGWWWWVRRGWVWLVRGVWFEHPTEPGRCALCSAWSNLSR
jgi:hypothetical protein